MEAFEIPAIQLVETFRPLVEEEDAGKADGVLTKVACVGAGIGAALLTAITWEFAAGAAAASSTFSVPLWPAVVTSGGSILGAVGVCYSAFTDESDLEVCVGDCGDDLECVEGCVAVARAEQDGQVDAAANLLQCVASCEGEFCTEACSGTVAPAEEE